MGWLPALAFLLGWLWWDWPTLNTLIRGIAPVNAMSRPPFGEGKIIWFLVGMTLVLVGYAGLQNLLARTKRSWRVAYHAVYAVLASLSLPWLSRDLLSFIAEGRLLDRYHLDPMRAAIVQVPHWRSDYWLAHASWQHTVNPYGPFWFLWMGLAGHLAPPFWPLVILLKAVNLGMVAAVVRVLGKIGPKGAGERFWFHPLVGIELLANCQNDALMVGLMAIGYEQYVHRHYKRFAAFWALALGIKFIPLILLPVLF
jgi:hypothetical protein